MTYHQAWNNAIFLHWQVDLNVLMQFILPGIDVDLFEGKAWVSVVAFTIEGIRPSFLPAFSPVSSFDEINVRTYTKDDGKAGVTFLNIEAGKRLSAMIARNVSKLPYRFSEMQRTESTFKSQNDQFEDRFQIDFSLAGELVQKSPLDIWLTERYALVQSHKAELLTYHVEHEEWPLRRILIGDLTVVYPRFQKLLHGAPQLAHFSDGVTVMASRKDGISR